MGSFMSVTMFLFSRHCLEKKSALPADFHGGWLAVGRVTSSLDVPVCHLSRPIGIFDMIYKEKSLLWATVFEVLVMIVEFM